MPDGTGYGTCKSPADPWMKAGRDHPKAQYRVRIISQASRSNTLSSKSREKPANGARWQSSFRYRQGRNLGTPYPSQVATQTRPKPLNHRNQRAGWRWPPLSLKPQELGPLLCAMRCMACPNNSRGYSERKLAGQSRARMLPPQLWVSGFRGPATSNRLDHRVWYQGSQ